MAVTGGVNSALQGAQDLSWAANLGRPCSLPERDWERYCSLQMNTAFSLIMKNDMNITKFR